LLPPLLVRLQEQDPCLEAQLSVENSLRVERRLLTNDLDVGFVGAHLAHRALSVRPFMEDTILRCTSSNDLLARRGRIAPRDVASRSLVVREPGSATRRPVDRWLARGRVSPQRTLQIGCPEAAKPIVRAGVGLSHGSEPGLEGEGGAGLSPLPPPGSALRRPICTAPHAGKAVGAALERLIMFVVPGSAARASRG
jgi:DNA-binding transcriptional LysR family regulator